MANSLAHACSITCSPKVLLNDVIAYNGQLGVEELMDLHVSIPQRFREALSKRFDPANATLSADRFVISVTCPLCSTYQSNNTYSCGDCPFAIWETIDEGCISWIKEVINQELSFWPAEQEIHWHRDKEDTARTQLTKLRQRAEELITWT